METNSEEQDADGSEVVKMWLLAVVELSLKWLKIWNNHESASQS